MAHYLLSMLQGDTHCQGVEDVLGQILQEEDGSDLFYDDGLEDDGISCSRFVTSFFQAVLEEIKDGTGEQQAKNVTIHFIYLTLQSKSSVPISARFDK